MRINCTWKEDRDCFGRDLIRYFQPAEIDYCCTDMEKAFENNLIKFGDGGDFPELNESPYLSILQWAYSTCTAFAITYCPFCGEKITYKKDKQT